MDDMIKDTEAWGRLQSTLAEALADLSVLCNDSEVSPETKASIQMMVSAFRDVVERFPPVINPQELIEKEDSVFINALSILNLIIVQGKIINDRYKDRIPQKAVATNGMRAMICVNPELN